MMIEDEELRNLYQISGEERLQKFEAGLLYLEEHPGDEATLELLRREIHSLKGDSRSVGLEIVAALAQQIEYVVRYLQHQTIDLTPAVSNCLYQGLIAIGQLVQAAVTGQPSEVDIEPVFNQLATTIAQLAVPPATPRFDPAPAATSAQQWMSPIEDETLREIYKTTTADRLQQLEEG